MENADACCAGNDRSGPQDRRRPVQIRFRDVDRDRQGSQGPERRHHPAHLGQEERAGMDAGMASRCVSALADAGRADLGARPLSEDRFPGHPLLCRAEEHAGADVARRGRSGAAEGLRQARHSAEGAGDPGRRAQAGRVVADRSRQRQWLGAAPRRGRCGVRFRLGRHHLQGGAGQGRRHLLLDLGRRSASIRNW